MATNKLQGWTKLLLALCGLALIAVLYTPIWRIDLDAPQYPEGLQLKIHANKLGGNVDIINGLNHYIGMKTLHKEDFIEFTLLPYIIGFFAAAFILVAIINKRRWLNLLFVLFIAFGIIAMADFWRWEYNYGHNLDPNAAIIVPGMAYQPPLIGFKQLLNFGAYSVPDTGGWIFIAVGLLLLFCFIAEWRKHKKIKKNSKLPQTFTLLFFVLLLLNGCNTNSQPIKIGTDNCYFCKMAITDARFGAELVTKKSKAYKFDDIHCLISFLQTKTIEQKSIGNIYLTDFSDNHKLIKAENTFLLKSEELKTPMNGNVAAFSNKDSMNKIKEQLKGIQVNWNELNK